MGSQLIAVPYSSGFRELLFLYYAGEQRKKLIAQAWNTL